MAVGNFGWPQFGDLTWEEQRKVKQSRAFYEERERMLNELQRQAALGSGGLQAQRGAEPVSTTKRKVLLLCS